MLNLHIVTVLTNKPAELRLMEPYRQLMRGNASASNSILLSPHSNPFTGMFYSLKNTHFLNAYVSFVAVLCEPLIVALANIPYQPGLAYDAFRVCTHLTIAILSMMIVGSLLVLCRKKTPKSALGRPDTLAGTMLALCGSHMLGNFKGMAQMRKGERDAIVKGWRKKYAMGSLIGVDGVEREGIDEQIFVKSARDA